MKKLLFVLLLGSCEGRCHRKDAVEAAMSPSALCTTSVEDERGVCIDGTSVFVCRTYGTWTYTARCAVAGTIAPTAEK
jgi:hypothetical protein